MIEVIRYILFCIIMASVVSIQIGGLIYCMRKDVEDVRIDEGYRP